MKNIRQSLFPGEVYNSNNHGKIEILEWINSRNVKIKFLNTGYIKSANAEMIKIGNIKDKLSKTNKGKAILGDGKYKAKDNNLAYKTWKNMITRCYSGCNNYKDIIVCEKWLNFQNFVPWFNEFYIKDYCLDKDLLIENNKIYSPETCIYVPRWVNNLFPKRKEKEGLPTGVLCNRQGKYYSRVPDIKKKEIVNKVKNTIEEAHIDYLETKSWYVMDCLEREDVPKKLIKPLTNRAEGMFLEAQKIKMSFK